MNVEKWIGGAVTKPIKIIDLFVDSDGVAKEAAPTAIRKPTTPDKYTQHYHVENGKMVKVMYSPLDCTNCIEAKRHFETLDKPMGNTQIINSVAQLRNPYKTQMEVYKLSILGEP